MNSSANRDLRAQGLGSRLRALLSDSLLYGAASALNKGIALVTFPLLARYFSVAAYGAIDYVMAAVNLLGLLLVFGQDSAVARFIHDSEDPAARRAVVSQGFAFQLAVVAVITPVLALVVPALVDDVPVAGRPAELTWLMLLQLPCLVVISFCSSLLRWTFQRGRYVLISLGSSAAFALGLVVALSVPGRTPVAVFTLYLGVQAGFALLALWLVRDWLSVPRRFPQLRAMLKFAAPVGANAVLLAMLPVYERMLANGVGDAAQLGLYAAGAKIAGLMTLATFAFQSGWGPFSLALHSDADAPRTYNAVFRLFACVACVAVLALSAAGPSLLVLLASQKYLGATAIIFPLSMGLALQGLAWVVETGTTISKRTHFALYANLALIATAAFACWMLARALGFLGVALGVCCGYIAYAAVTFVLAGRAWTFPWSFRPVLAVIAVTLLVGVAQFLAWLHFGMLASAVVCLAGILVVALFSWWKVFDAEERRQLLRRFGRDGR